MTTNGDNVHRVHGGPPAPRTSNERLKDVQIVQFDLQPALIQHNSEFEG